MPVLADYLKERGLLDEELLNSAFLSIDRKDFVPEEHKRYAYKDIALPIGYSQTISQPQVVAFMLNLLDVKPGQTVLDIGFGSGWATCLLAEVVGLSGKVIAVERVREVYEYGKKNIEKYNFIKKGVVEVFLGDGKEGKKDKAPYDRVLVSAENKEGNLPSQIKNQLKEGGKMVLPIGSSIFLFIKKKEGFETKEYHGFSFVPLL